MEKVRPPQTLKTKKQEKDNKKGKENLKKRKTSD